MNGIHYNLSPTEYFGMPGVSKHGLDILAKSPLHYWAAYLDPEKEPPKETPAKALGTAIHMCILEPERFDKTYVQEPQPKDYPDALDTGDQYKEACKVNGLKVSGTKAELKGRLILAGFKQEDFFDSVYDRITAGKQVLKPQDMYACMKVSSRVRSNPTAKALFDPLEGKPEVSIFWTDEDTGVDCRGRLDWYLDYGTIVDIKSTLNAGPENFSHSVLKYRYWVQAAMYMDGLKALHQEPRDFVFAAWEKYPPYASAFYYATPELLDAGRKEYKRLLKLYKQCVESDNWPGYSLKLEPLVLPNYSIVGEETEEKDWLEGLDA